MATLDQHWNRSVALSVMTVIAPILIATGCKDPTSPTAPQTPRNSPLQFLGMAHEHLEEGDYQVLLARCQKSSDPMALNVLDYDIISRRMRPVDDKTVDSEAAKRRMLGRPASSFHLLAEIMLRHKDPWRRWTIASVLGDCGSDEVVPQLRVLINDPESFVRNYAGQAIAELSARRAAATTQAAK